MTLICRRPASPRLPALLAAALAAWSYPALAHEPLWGESPQTFAFGVRHPEIRFGFENDYRMLSGGRSTANPTGLRRSRLDGMASFQYAPNTSLNVRIEVPFAQVTTAQTVGGQRKTSSTRGLGDIVLSTKSRFYQRYGEDWKVHQSVIGGIQLPTGSRGGAYPDGTPLGVADRPGSGHFGVILGYAYAMERLHDTTWASAVYRREIGDRERRGDMLEVDANYGYWVRRALQPQDLGIILAAGPHVECVGRDRMNSAPDSDSGYTLLGLQGSFIATMGPSQFRLGVMAPFYQHVNGAQLRPEVIVRAGAEWLF